jgi:hypothetical protein
MARFADDVASAPVPQRPKSYYDLIVEDVKRCEPETRDKVMEAIEDLSDDINNSAYVVIYDSIDEYEMEAELYDDQRCVIDEIKEVVESNASQRTLSLIYYRGKRIKYEVTLTH